MKFGIGHPSPIICRSLVEGLAAAGVEAHEAQNDVVDWLQSNQAAGAVLPLNHDSWTWIVEMFPDALLIAPVDEESSPQFSRAYAQQARGVAAITWEVGRIVRAINDAVEGFAMIPFAVAREMAYSTVSGLPTDLVLSATEAEALKQLCSGKTVVAIADQLAYSEREMHRILGGLYVRMGVSHRAEAIVSATRWGLADQ